MKALISKLKEYRKEGWIGALVGAITGCALYWTGLGDGPARLSYDLACLQPVLQPPSDVIVIEMDELAYRSLHQDYDKLWDRALHARLLEQLRRDGARLVVFDVFLSDAGTNSLSGPALAEATEKNRRLAVAIRENARVVLAVEWAESTHPGIVGASVLPPFSEFEQAASNRWGIARVDAESDLTIRRHYNGTGTDPSLTWSGAAMLGAPVTREPERRLEERWLRYYGPSPAFRRLSYHLALEEPSEFFKDKLVFVGGRPRTLLVGQQTDVFRTPFMRWGSEYTPGVELIATAVLNLVRDDWLRRLPVVWELGLILFCGLVFGYGLSGLRPLVAAGWTLLGIAIIGAAAVALVWTQSTWFSWIAICGIQVPIAFAWAVVTSKVRHAPVGAGRTVVDAEPGARVPNVPDTPDYELFHPPFGEGAYGKVWLARNAIGQWQALKAVYQANFKQSHEPYEREFRGIKRYKPVSDKHPGLLRVDFVSRKKWDGYFYYVMELGDAHVPGWEENPATYKPRDLASVRAQADGRRLPVRECVQIVRELAQALDFLHRQGLTHRDIKPSNIIFVNGRPRLADVGLVAEIQLSKMESTWVGTPGYMPPPPEPPGTPQADIYGLGMVLYVISTGRDPALFPELSTTLVERTGQAEFIELNEVILKACDPDRARRYASAAEMDAALLKLKKVLESGAPKPRLEGTPTEAPPPHRLVAITQVEHHDQMEEFRRKHRLALLTLMFTDIVGATQLKNDLGDPSAIALIQEHHALVRALLTQFRESKEIETAGDSFLLVFATPSDAVTFSVTLQARLGEMARRGSPSVLDRIGIHLGEVMVQEHESESKDLFGMQVDICARVMSLAKGGQILMTRSTFDNARQTLKGRKIVGLQELAWQNHGLYTLAGVEEPVEICEVGETGSAPLTPPSDSDKVRRCVRDI